MKFRRPMLVATFLLIFLHRCLLATSDQCEDGREFGYNVGTENGPENWASLCSDWETCGNGKAQSPINIIHKEAHHSQDLGRLSQTYKPTNAVLVNRGHDIMVKWEDGAGSINVEGTEYFLRQMHWHSPSEHALNHTRFILEGHMVHESADKKIAAIGFFYKSGQPDPFISKLMGPIQAIAGKKGAETSLGIVDPKGVKVWRKRYYRYHGSLTAIPCTEGVIWTIMRKVSYVSYEQMKVLTEAVLREHKMNARPMQPINDRRVHAYNP